MTTNKDYRVECTGCDAILQRQYDSDKDYICEMAEGLGWQYIRQGHGGNYFCPECQKRDMTIKQVRTLCEDYIFYQGKYGDNIPLHRILSVIKRYKDDNGDMSLLMKTKPIAQVITIIKNSALELEEILGE